MEVMKNNKRIRIIIFVVCWIASLLASGFYILYAFIGLNIEHKFLILAILIMILSCLKLAVDSNQLYKNSKERKNLPSDQNVENQLKELKSTVSELERQIQNFKDFKENTKIFSEVDVKTIKELIRKNKYEYDRRKTIEKTLGNIDIQSFSGKLFVTNIPPKLVETLKGIGFEKTKRKNPKNGIEEEMYAISEEYFDKYSLSSLLFTLVKSRIIK